MDETTSTGSHHPESAVRVTLGVGHSVGLNMCLMNDLYGYMCVKSLQSCPTLCDPMNYGPPGFSLQGDSAGKNPGVGYHGLPRESSQPRGQTHVSHVCCTGRWVLYH